MPDRPDHIDSTKLPARVYWKSAGRGYWYTSWRENGRQRTKRIAGPDATLSQIHRAMEDLDQVERGTLKYLVEQFEASDQFAKLAPATRRDYTLSAKGLNATRMRSGQPLGSAPLSSWSRPVCQKLIDKIARERGPSAANHALRYLKRLFRWGINRGHLNTNHAKGVEAAVERKRRRCPTDAEYDAVLAFARACGAKKAHTKGSCASYLWAVMELAYLLRLRGAEILDLTDADVTPDGVRVRRRKGSRGNVTAWSPRVRAAWEALADRRAAIIERRGMATPLHARDRRLVLAEGGESLDRSSLSTAMDRLIKSAIAEGCLDAGARFSLHDLKRRGVTKTKGGWNEKREGSGHKSDAMREVYDQSVPIVKPVED